MARTIKSISYSILYRIVRSWYRLTVRVNPRLIIFSSYVDYSDNSRTLSEYLVANGYTEKYDIYWSVKNVQKCRSLFPDAKVTFFSDKGFKNIFNIRYYYQAAWQFATHSIREYHESHSPEQHFIKLWHGCSYKDKDVTIKKGNARVSCDKVLVAGPFFIKTKAYFWGIPEDKILSIGYPRYDELKEKTPQALELYNQEKGDANKIIIWMPTFRNDISGRYTDTENISQFPLLYDNESWRQLDIFCQENKVTMLVKLHPFQKKYDICWSEMKNIHQIDNSDFDNAGTSMYSFLAVTDGLITDYSSVGVDYMLVDKPIAYTLDDYKLYKDGRGFVVSNVLDYMPGHHLYCFEDLKKFIKEIAGGIDSHKHQRRNLMGNIIYESKHYCEDIVRYFGL